MAPWKIAMQATLAGPVNGISGPRILRAKNTRDTQTQMNSANPNARLAKTCFARIHIARIIVNQGNRIGVEGGSTVRSVRAGGGSSIAHADLLKAPLLGLPYVVQT